jgi:hypothetical protein
MSTTMTTFGAVTKVSATYGGSTETDVVIKGRRNKLSVRICDDGQHVIIMEKINSMALESMLVGDRELLSLYYELGKRVAKMNLTPGSPEWQMANAGRGHNLLS